MMTGGATRGQEPDSHEVVTRFAPSPTGLLHLGHAWSAIRSYDRAREAGGRFLLRIEDIDGTRSRPGFLAAIEADLAWLGLGWDSPVVRQSDRLALYAAALEQLRAMGLLYPCFCTRAEIAASLSAPHGAPERVYPGTCRHLDESDRARRIATEQHAWRLDTTAAVAMTGPLTWVDEIAGRVIADSLSHGDVIVARKETPASYHLAVTVDDAAQGVTHVVRGADLFAATHVHRLLQALLDLPVPVWRHHALIAGPDGERLAKRHGAPSLAAMREAGGDGRALADALRAGEVPIGFSLVNA
jgi:glutamyl-Q tRNA(Asp) synthetase